MRAYAIKGFGTVGSVQDHPIGEPAAGEVLVAVKAAGVNVMDPIYVAGWMKDYQEHRFPYQRNEVDGKARRGRAMSSIVVFDRNRLDGFCLRGQQAAPIPG
jgi:hypothetical protein